MPSKVIADDWQNYGRPVSFNSEYYGARMQLLNRASGNGRWLDSAPETLVGLASSGLSDEDMVDQYLGAAGLVGLNQMRESFELIPEQFQDKEFGLLPEQAQNSLVAQGYKLPSEKGKSLLSRAFTWDNPLLPEEHFPAVFKYPIKAVIAPIGFGAGFVARGIWEVGAMKLSRWAQRFYSTLNYLRPEVDKDDMRHAAGVGGFMGVPFAGYAGGLIKGVATSSPGTWREAWNASKRQEDTYDKLAVEKVKNLLGDEETARLRKFRLDGGSGVVQDWLDEGFTLEQANQKWQQWYSNLQDPDYVQAEEILNTNRNDVVTGVIEQWNEDTLLPNLKPGSNAEAIVGVVGAMAVEVMFDPSTWVGTWTKHVYKPAKGVLNGLRSADTEINFWRKATQALRVSEDATDFRVSIGDDFGEYVGSSGVKNRILQRVGRHFQNINLQGRAAAMNRFIDRVNHAFQVEDRLDLARVSILEAAAKNGEVLNEVEIAKRVADKTGEVSEMTLLVRDFPKFGGALGTMREWHRTQKSARLLMIPNPSIVVMGNVVDFAPVIAKTHDLTTPDGWWAFLKSGVGKKRLQAGGLGVVRPEGVYLPSLSLVGEQWVKGKRWIHQTFDPYKPMPSEITGSFAETVRNYITGTTDWTIRQMLDMVQSGRGLSKGLTKKLNDAGVDFDELGRIFAEITPDLQGSAVGVRAMVKGKSKGKVKTVGRAQPRGTDFVEAIKNQYGLNNKDVLELVKKYDEVKAVSLKAAKTGQIDDVDDMLNFYQGQGWRYDPDSGTLKPPKPVPGAWRAAQNYYDRVRHPVGSLNDEIGRFWDSKITATARSALVAGAYYPAKLVMKMTTYTPLTRHLDVLDDGAIDDFVAMANMGVLGGVPRQTIDDYITAFIAGDEGVRWAVQSEFMLDFLGRSGAIAIGGPDVERFFSKFIARANQKYNLLGSDADGLRGISGRKGVWPSAFQDGHYSALNVIPDYRELAAVAKHMAFYRRLGWGLHMPFIDKMFAKWWRPAVLLRLGYVARNGGEELATFAFREGPRAAINMRLARKTTGVRSTFDIYGRKVTVDISGKTPSFSTEAADLVKQARHEQHRLWLWRPFGALWRSMNEIAGVGDAALTLKALRRTIETSDEWKLLGDAARVEKFKDTLVAVRAENNFFLFDWSKNLYAWMDQKAIRLGEMFSDPGRRMGFASGMFTKEELAARTLRTLSSTKKAELYRSTGRRLALNPTIMDKEMQNILNGFDTYLDAGSDVMHLLRPNRGDVYKLPINYQRTGLAIATTEQDNAIALTQSLGGLGETPEGRAIIPLLQQQVGDDLVAHWDEVKQILVEEFPELAHLLDGGVVVPDEVAELAKPVSERVTSGKRVDFAEDSIEHWEDFDVELSYEEVDEIVKNMPGSDHQPEGWVEPRHQGGKAQTRMLGDGESYYYTGNIYTGDEFPPALLALMRRVEEATGYSFDMALVQKYPDAASGLGKHADKRWRDTDTGEIIVGPAKGVKAESFGEPVIASISFGDKKPFVFYGPDGVEVGRLDLGQGDLVLMHGGAQNNLSHELLPSEGITPKHTIPMNFTYGEKGALPKASGVTADTTFEAIKRGERTATTRKTNQVKNVEIGDLVTIKGPNGESLVVRITDKRGVIGVKPETWAKLEGYDVDAAKANYYKGKEFSKQTQLVYEVVSEADLPSYTGRINITFRQSGRRIANGEQRAFGSPVETHNTPVTHEVGRKGDIVVDNVEHPLSPSHVSEQPFFFTDASGTTRGFRSIAHAYFAHLTGEYLSPRDAAKRLGTFLMDTTGTSNIKDVGWGGLYRPISLDGFIHYLRGDRRAAQIEKLDLRVQDRTVMRVERPTAIRQAEVQQILKDNPALTPKEADDMVTKGEWGTDVWGPIPASWDELSADEAALWARRLGVMDPSMTAENVPQLMNIWDETGEMVMKELPHEMVLKNKLARQIEAWEKFGKAEGHEKPTMEALKDQLSQTPAKAPFNMGLTERNFQTPVFTYLDTGVDFDNLQNLPSERQASTLLKGREAGASSRRLFAEILVARFEYDPAFRAAILSGDKIVINGERVFGARYTQELMEALRVRARSQTQEAIAKGTSPVVTAKEFSVARTQKNRTALYVFGDNVKGKGKGGTAVIRDEQNAIGIPTKFNPGTKADDYFTDGDLDALNAIDDAFDRIEEAFLTGRYSHLVFPEGGIGTGLAKLEEKAPRTFQYVQQRIAELTDKIESHHLFRELSIRGAGGSSVKGTVPARGVRKIYLPRLAGKGTNKSSDAIKDAIAGPDIGVRGTAVKASSSTEELQKILGQNDLDGIVIVVDDQNIARSLGELEHQSTFKEGEGVSADEFVHLTASERAAKEGESLAIDSYVQQIIRINGDRVPVHIVYGGSGRKAAEATDLTGAPIARAEDAPQGPQTLEAFLDEGEKQTIAIFGSEGKTDPIFHSAHMGEGGQLVQTLRQQKAKAGVTSAGPKTVTVKRIISGGQTGADQQGLLTAQALGLETGGFATDGFKGLTQGKKHTGQMDRQQLEAAGLVPVDPKTYKGKYPASKLYNRRTEYNVLHADGTVVIDLTANGRSPGSILTRNIVRNINRGEYAEDFGKQGMPSFEVFVGSVPLPAVKKELRGIHVVVSADDPELAMKLQQWIVDNDIETLNMAGNGAGREVAKGYNINEVTDRLLRDGVGEAQDASKPFFSEDVASVTPVHYGKKQNRPLSNLAHTPFRFRGAEYASAEAAYQTWKSGVFHEGIADLHGPAAKAAGKNITVDREISSALMSEILAAKAAQVPEFRNALLDSSLITHPVEDKFWAGEFPRLMETLKKTLTRTENVTPVRKVAPVTRSPRRVAKKKVVETPKSSREEMGNIIDLFRKKFGDQIQEIRKGLQDPVWSERILKDYDSISQWLEATITDPKDRRLFEVLLGENATKGTTGQFWRELLVGDADPSKLKSFEETSDLVRAKLVEQQTTTPEGQAALHAQEASGPRSGMSAMAEPGTVIVYHPMLPEEYRPLYLQVLSILGKEDGSVFQQEFLERINRKLFALGRNPVSIEDLQMLHPSSAGIDNTASLVASIPGNQGYFTLPVGSMDGKLAWAMATTFDEMDGFKGLSPNGSTIGYTTTMEENITGRVSNHTRKYRSKLVGADAPKIERGGIKGYTEGGEAAIIGGTYFGIKNGQVYSSHLLDPVERRILSTAPHNVDPIRMRPVPQDGTSGPALETVWGMKRVLANGETKYYVANNPSDVKRLLHQGWVVEDTQVVPRLVLDEVAKENTKVIMDDLVNYTDTTNAVNNGKEPQFNLSLIREAARLSEGKELNALRIFEQNSQWLNDNKPELLLFKHMSANDGLLDKWRNQVLGYFFDGVAHPMIAAISREPLLLHYVTEALEQTKEMLTFRNHRPGEYSRLETFFKKHVVIDDADQVTMPIIDEIIKIHSQKIGMSEEAADFDSVLRGLLDPDVNVKQIRWRLSAFLESTKDQLKTTGRALSQQEKEFFRFWETLNNLQYDEVIVDFKKWFTNSVIANEEHMNVAIQRGMHNTGQFIDDHRVRSQFQEMVGTLVPFWFAEDQFLRRMGRSLVQNPTLLRNVNITMNAGVNAGWVAEDQFGEKRIVYPGSEMFTTAMLELTRLPVISQVFGGDLASVDPGRLTSSIHIIPGYDVDQVGNFGFGPLLAIPLLFASQSDPTIKSTFEKNLIGGRYDMGRGILDADSAASIVWSSVVPAILSKGMSTIWSGTNESARAKATMDVIALMNIQGTLPTEEEIAAQPQPDVYLERFMDRVGEMAKQYQMLQSITWFGGPAAFGFEDLTVKNEHWETNEEFMELVNSGLPWEEAYMVWTERIVARDGVFDPYLYSPFRTGRTSKVPFAVITATQEANIWLADNSDFVGDYLFSSAFFMPRGFGPDEGEYSSEARNRAIAYGLIDEKTPEEFLRKVYFDQAYSVYARERQAYLTQRYEMKAAGANTMRVDREWQAWANSFRKTHPVYANYLSSGNADDKRAQTIKEFRYLLQDPSMAPAGEHNQDILDTMKTIVGLVDELEGLRHMSYGGVGNDRNRIKKEYYGIMTEFATGKPWLNELYYSMFLPILGDTWLAKYNAGLLGTISAGGTL